MIDFNMYKEVKDLKEVHIIHMYDTGEKCIDDNSGYHDSRHFRLVGYNFTTMEKCEMGIHDGINFLGSESKVYNAGIFIDGSFFIRFSKPTSIDYKCQLVMID